MDGFNRELLARMPLAQSVLLLFSHALDEAFLDRLFDAHRGACYEKELTFATFVYLIREALVLHGGSGRAAFQRAQQDGCLPCSPRAVYGKLGRIPLGLSAALLAHGTAKLLPLLPGSRQPLAPSLAELQPIVFDGKTVKFVAAQLKPLRKRRGRINSGKMLVAQDLASGLALAMQPTANSEANDVSLVQELLKRLDPAEAGRRLFLADSQFCDLPRLEAFSADAQHFLIRYNGNVSFHPDEARASQSGTDAQGRRWVQEWGWLGRAAHPQRRYVRRITLPRPGQKDVSVVTDLLDERAYPATDLLEAYLQRWGIERMFQQITEVFDLKELIGTHPQATLFQAAFCLLLYNMVQLIRAYVAAAGQAAVEAVSTEKLFEDVQMELISWSTVGEAQAAVELVQRPRSIEQMRDRLGQLLGRLWRERWRKAPAQKKHGRTKKTVYPKKGYSNVWKVLQAYQQARRKAKQQP